jgi:deazaflavin-dependent oxidoreductase (nitroreductase family)
LGATEHRVRRLVGDAMRQVVKRTVNRHQLRTAGRPGARAALIRHTGRTSGRPYGTPVTATPTADGFLIALPYGRRADWVRNVLAAGGATLVRDGVEYTVTDPEVVGMSAVASHFVPGDRRVHRIFGVDEVLRLTRE